MLFIFVLFSPVAFAATFASASGENQFDCTANKVANVFAAVMTTNSCGSSIAALTVGVTPSLAAQDPNLASELTNKGYNPDQYVNGSGVGMLAQLANYSYRGTIQTGPDSITFVADKINPNRVSAQSSALQGLSPILVLWGTLRNVTYILIALALVLIGLSMYFRSKQGKQDNFNVATQLTDLIFTLITITLSYVVAGVVVDLVINVGNVAIASFFNPFINSTSILNNLYTPGSGTNIFSMLGDFQGSTSSSSVINIAQQGLNYLNTPVDNTATFIQRAVRIPVIDVFFQALASVIFGIAKGVATSSVNEPLITAILAFTIFLLIFRIAFLLLGSFVGIILTIGFAPLILIPGAFPGPSAVQVFVDWMKRIISYALVFPIVLALTLLAAIFLNLGAQDQSGDCVYNKSATATGATSINIPGTQNQSGIYNSTRFTAPNSTTVQSTTDSYANTRKCYPILLPPKFNWLPAPIGNLGNGFEIDDFTRFIVGISLIIILPNITKTIQEALKIKQSSLVSVKDALAGAGTFNTFLGFVPFIGKPLSQVTGSITGAIGK